jgi:cell division topological specificity factor
MWLIAFWVKPLILDFYMPRKKAFLVVCLEDNMALLDYFLRKKEKQVTTASKAKERLQIIVAHERNSRNKQPDYLPQLTADILEVLRKYIKVTDESFSINLDNKGGDLNVLELNIELSDENSIN